MTSNRLTSALAASVLVAASLLASAAQAYTLEEFQFDSPIQERQFRELTGKLRCLVCQNESLAASQSDLAQDLRKEVYGMMKAGKSQAEIMAFLVDRYGDFVLYEPPFKPSTYLLWIGPFLLVGLGGVFLVRAIRRKKTEPEQALSADEQARIDQLLAAAGGDSQNPTK